MKTGLQKPEKGITQTRKGDYEDPNRGSRKSEIRITENGITENYNTEIQGSELLKCVRMRSEIRITRNRHGKPQNFHGKRFTI